MVREEQPRSLCDAAAPGSLRWAHQTWQTRRDGRKMQGRNTLGCLWVKMLLHQQGLGPSSMTRTHSCQSVTGNFQKGHLSASGRFSWGQEPVLSLLERRVWALGSEKPLTAMTARPHELLLGLVLLLPALPMPSNAGMDPSASLPARTRRSWLSPRAVLLMEFDRERVKRAIVQPKNLRQLRFWARDGNETAQAWGDSHHSSWCPYAASRLHSPSLLKPRAYCLRLGEHKKRMDWITGELRGFRKIKLLSTETVPHVGLDALECSSILITTYLWATAEASTPGTNTLWGVTLNFLYSNKQQQRSNPLLQAERQGKNIYFI